MNIVEILRQHAASRPRATALIDYHRGRQQALTFAELELASARAAALLRHAGLRTGDAVLVFYPMSAQLYIVLMAIFRLGLVAMFLDPSAGREHLERCCALHAPQGLIASAKAHLLRLISPALRRIPHKFAIGPPLPGATRLQRAERLAPDEEIMPCTRNTPALLTFTSGSTGQPKAAMRTHGFLLAQHQVLAKSLHLTAGETDLTTLPIFVLANLASGVTSLIPDADLRFPGAIDPAPILSQIQTHQPVSTAASPAFLERLADYCIQHDQMLTNFRKIFTGGAPVFPRLLDKLQSLAPPAQVTAVYGSTEAEPIAHIDRHQISAEDMQAMLSGRGLLAGPPVSEIQLRILRNQWGQPVGPYTNADFLAACLPADQPGEIVVNGEHVLSGYLHGQGDEETKFRVDGAVWHRRGDAGYLDQAGRLWLLGRCAAHINDHRGELYPFAVECAAHHFPGVHRAAVVAHHDQRLLAVELSNQAEGVSLESLKQAISWAHIDAVRALDRIPVDKRHNAKIDYPALFKLLGQEAKLISRPR
jgi:acyl-CoA synthetase (AMP-forming)/AMP-acid ligase II